MEQTLLYISVLNTAFIQLLKWVAEQAGILISGVWAKILSWACPLATVLALDAMGVINASFFGCLLWGVFAALASNGIYDLKKLWA